MPCMLMKASLIVNPTLDLTGVGVEGSILRPMSLASSLSGVTEASLGRSRYYAALQLCHGPKARH